jgi:pimeloyl-ACP methyl ester carboxylesterase
MQYASIHQGDLDAIDNPALADYVPYAESRDIAVAALAALRAQPGIIPSGIVLVGHSLGGTRALQVAATDPGVCALVLLAPAYSSRLGVRPSLAAEETVEALKTHNLDADAGIPRYVFNAKHSLFPPPLNDAHFDALDRDDDETLRRWEIASALVLAHLDAGDTSDLTDATDFNGAPFPADVLTPAFDRDVPTLAVFGGLDSMSVHAPLLGRTPAERAGSGKGSLSVVILANLGHNLGPVRPRDNPDFVAIAGPVLTGPIDQAIPDLIARWLTEVLERTPLQNPGREPGES